MPVLSASREFPEQWAELRYRMLALTDRKSQRPSPASMPLICSREARRLAASECGFSYRHSRFNSYDRDRFIVTRVEYRLKDGGEPTLEYADLKRAFTANANPSLKEVGEAVRRIRQSKGMFLVEGDPDCRSAGSFFKNPIVSAEHAAGISDETGAHPPQFPAGPDQGGKVKLPAAWLIERAGFAKGSKLGRAGISTKHTLALVNLGGATDRDSGASRPNQRCSKAAIPYRPGNGTGNAGILTADLS